MSHHESVSPRAFFPCSFEHRNRQTDVWPAPCALIFLERKMPDHSFEFSPKLLMKLLAASFLLYLASQSFFVAIFLVLAVGTHIKRKISKSKDRSSRHAKNAPADVAPNQAAVVSPQPQPIQPTVPKRQYAKSAVVIPFKTGTDN
jgi:hypothetical protein